MTELELFDNLGILLDPEQNRVSVTPAIRENINMLSSVFSEMNTQKRRFGTLNPDIWLELIPWHSLN
jgi:hypothetical protein